VSAAWVEDERQGRSVSHSLSESVIRRFWKYVDRRGEGECWPWTAHTKEEGYGLLFLENVNGNKRSLTAHRVSYQLHSNTTIGSDVVVRHKCDNPRCCNPNHLIAGAILDNIKDRQDRNRQAKGERSGKAKVTEEIVISIRREYVRRKVTYQSLATKYGLCRRQVWMIVRKRSWSHVQ
jgi:hypothetical protein